MTIRIGTKIGDHRALRTRPGMIDGRAVGRALVPVEEVPA